MLYCHKQVLSEQERGFSSFTLILVYSILPSPNEAVWKKKLEAFQTHMLSQAAQLLTQHDSMLPFTGHHCQDPTSEKKGRKVSSFYKETFAFPV